VRLAVGNIDVPVYVRSAAKPFIAAAVVASGAAVRFGFDRKEIALIAASHNGEEEHVATVRSILAKIGLDESALRCGALPSRTALQNNCSGKHAGILALCLTIGADIRTYLEPEHPAQQRILGLCARLVGENVGALPIGTDGCGIPVFAASLRNIAGAFARFASLHGVREDDAQALLVVREAMLAHPWYVAGTDRFDTRLMEVAQGNIVAKVGAEGMYGVGVLNAGIGLAAKIIDGADRATPPAVIALLEEFGALSEAQREKLEFFARREIRNVAGRVVGEIAVFPERGRTDEREETV
jgi:L-asparaginase II